MWTRVLDQCPPEDGSWFLVLNDDGSGVSIWSRTGGRFGHGWYDESNRFDGDGPFSREPQTDDRYWAPLPVDWVPWSAFQHEPDAGE